jgi:acetoin utilization protein AcuB
MENPSVDRFMIHDPITIERGQPLTTARRLMQTHHIRHLPVLLRGKLVGVVSQRDLLNFDRILDLDQTLVPVGEAMTKPAFCVRPDAALSDVAAEMAARHYGSAVVVDEEQRVLGLLTAGDGLRALAALLDPPSVAEPAVATSMRCPSPAAASAALPSQSGLRRRCV